MFESDPYTFNLALSWARMAGIVPAAANPQPITSSGQAEPVHAYGEVLSIDPGAGTISIHHVQMENRDGFLRMPTVSMVLPVGEKTQLQGLRPGDWMSFEAARMGGQLTLKDIKKGRPACFRSGRFALRQAQRGRDLPC